MKKENVTQSDQPGPVRRGYQPRDGEFPELLTDRQLAIKLGSTPRQIRAWRIRRIIPSIKISYRVVRFRLSSVLDALEKRSTKPWREGARGR